MQSAPAKVSFKEQMHQARERAILQSACDLLGEKSFDAMTMDDVAGKVGIAKASLYKHFGSKEELCSAAMVEVLSAAQAYLKSLDGSLSALDKLQAAVRWSLERLLAQEMPLLPSRNSTLRAVLMANRSYADGVIEVSDLMGEWITQAQEQGVIDADLPPIVVLYTLYARACDPVVGFLKDSTLYRDEEIVDLVLRTCFEGLRAR
ncbi:MAG: TetR/AcrR family transcriptional regulator [Burkholderiaceae bacterium]|nr:TetR/AcrR family transcriptional regulator [Burkholderiaceae bacterium]MCO5104044.1 TetR/AcrR family transcriptional regulator [Burkholderiaceae bacterium]